MSDDGPDDLDAHAIGKLNRVGKDLAILDGLLAFGLSIKPDDDDLIGLACFLQGSACAQGRRVCLLYTSPSPRDS